MRPGYHDIKSLLPLQVSVYFHTVYAPAFFVLQLLLFIYKGVMLPYPTSAIGLEVAFVFAYGILQAFRLWMTSMGNKTESISLLVWGLCLSAPVVVFHAYMIRLQVYVLRLDQIINGIGLVFIGAEVILCLVAVVIFLRAQRF